MAEPCLEAGDEARPQPEEEMQAPMVAVETEKEARESWTKAAETECPTGDRT